MLTSFTTSSDLSDRIRMVFDILDHEGVGSLNHEDLMVYTCNDVCMREHVCVCACS